MQLWSWIIVTVAITLGESENGHSVFKSAECVQLVLLLFRKTLIKTLEVRNVHRIYPYTGPLKILEGSYATDSQCCANSHLFMATRGQKGSAMGAHDEGLITTPGRNHYEI